MQPNAYCTVLVLRHVGKTHTGSAWAIPNCLGICACVCVCLRVIEVYQRLIIHFQGTYVPCLQCQSSVMCRPPPLRIAMQAVSILRCGDSGDRCHLPCDRGCSPHRQIMDGMSYLGRAMAFAARVWDANQGRFSMSLEQATWYAENIDAAIEVEHELICSNHMPRRRFTLRYVEELLATRPASARTGRRASAIGEATSA